MKIMRNHADPCFPGPGLRPLLVTLPRPQASRRAGALVVSLVFIILITIVLVGFVTTTGLERTTVQSHLGRVQAELYNTMAADVVASKIVLATSSTNSWWASQPGRIAYTPFGNSPTTTLLDLHSGTAATVQSDVSVNLNPASLTKGVGVVVGDPTVTLPVKWIYIRKDGSQQVADTAAPVFDKANPWVGRYAY